MNSFKFSLSWPALIQYQGLFDAVLIALQKTPVFLLSRRIRLAFIDEYFRDFLTNRPFLRIYNKCIISLILNQYF